nr:3-hydroxyacyl-CoA dehydrogenase NAD-binding domain-containing protein [uncultured Brevundimonas sp.]
MVEVRGVSDIRRVAVVGAGLIGSGWVAAFLAKGLEVVVHDPSPGAGDRLSERLDQAWSVLKASGAVVDPRPEPSVHADLEAVADADFIQESTPENLAAKVALFQRLDALAPADVLISSSTSNFALTQLQDGCRHPERCVLGHPFNPVHLMPLVEVGGGERTAPEAVGAARDFYASLGKETVLLKREALGHIANRLTAAMFREAVSLVEGGYAEVEDVDRALRFGPALKWAIQGQFMTFHTSGGAEGLEGFLEHFGDGVAARWASMTTPNLADAALRARLVEQMTRATAGRTLSEITHEQDRKLVDLLRLLGSS